MSRPRPARTTAASPKPPTVAGVLGRVAGFGGDPVVGGVVDPDAPPHAVVRIATSTVAAIVTFVMDPPSRDRLVEVRGDRCPMGGGGLDHEPPPPAYERRVRHEVSLVEAEQAQWPCRAARR